MPWSKWSAIIILYLLLHTTASAEIIDYQVGGKALHIPDPVNMLEISRDNPDIQRVGVATTPPTNRFLAYYALQDEYKQAVLGKLETFTRYILMQTHRTVEKLDLKPAEFQQIAAVFRQQHKTLIDSVKDEADEILKRASKQISEDTGSVMSLKMTGNQSLGIFMDEQDTIAMANLINYKQQVDGKTSEVLMVGGTVIMNVAGKILYFYVYNNYHDRADYEWVVAKSAEWARAIRSSNL
jgi:hypothetical protein